MIGIRIVWVAGVLAVAAPPMGAMAQTSTGNIWNGRQHEPDAGAVHADEHAAGVATPPAQAQQENNFVENQAKALVDKTHRDTGAPAPQP